MKYTEHLKRFTYKVKLLIDENKKIENSSEDEKDYSVFFTEAHWAAFHLVSALLDYIEIPDNLKHLNHRNIKRALISDNIIEILGKDATEINSIYTNLLNYYSIGEYSYSSNVSLKEFEDFKDQFKKLKEIVKRWMKINAQK